MTAKPVKVKKPKFMRDSKYLPFNRNISGNIYPNRRAIIVSGGFRETGEKGKALEDEIRRLKQIVGEQPLDSMALKELLSKTF